jgi:hypothetical protein
MVTEARPTLIAGVLELLGQPFSDHRGAFLNAFRAQEPAFAQALGDPGIAQVNLSRTEAVGAVRGPHLLRLLAGNQFDTIYHEHVSYLSLRVWLAHQGAAEVAKHGLLEFLLQAKREGRRVLGYGASAKGNTLLNYAGIQADLLPAVPDRAPSKQGIRLLGSQIHVISTVQLTGETADALLVLAWNRYTT